VTVHSTHDTIAAIRLFADRFSLQLDEFATFDASMPATLAESIRYSLLGPGKRLRPFLVYECGRLCGAADEACFAPAAALEMIHAFSLIHDDLPAMDDDDLRRGRPTNHKQFGEAMAILAGDALVTLAFETLTTKTIDRNHTGPLVRELATASGGCGMIGGQVRDIEAQAASTGGSRPLPLNDIRAIHEGKTGALFSAACRMGGIVGDVDVDTLERLGAFGLNLGIAFQITDDLLDVTASAAQMGKQVGKDQEKGKQTYPQSVGIDRSRELGSEAARMAIESLAEIEGDTSTLRALAKFAHQRDR